MLCIIKLMANVHLFKKKKNFLSLKAAQKEVEDKIWAHEPWFPNVWARSMYQHDIEYKHILPKETYILMPFL